MKVIFREVRSRNFRKTVISNWLQNLSRGPARPCNGKQLLICASRGLAETSSDKMLKLATDIIVLGMLHRRWTVMVCILVFFYIKLIFAIWTRTWKPHRTVKPKTFAYEVTCTDPIVSSKICSDYYFIHGSWRTIWNYLGSSEVMFCPDLQDSILRALLYGVWNINTAKWMVSRSMAEAKGVSKAWQVLCNGGPTSLNWESSCFTFSKRMQLP